MQPLLDPTCLRPSCNVLGPALGVTLGLIVDDQFGGDSADKYPRLGEAGNDVSKLDGVEVIDLSDLPVESLTGHLYHIYSEAVGRDLSQLLNDGKHAVQRPDLVKVGSNLWKLQWTDQAE